MIALVIGVAAALGFVALGLGVFVLDKSPPPGLLSAGLCAHHPQGGV